MVRQGRSPGAGPRAGTRRERRVPDGEGTREGAREIHPPSTNDHRNDHQQATRQPCQDVGVGLDQFLDPPVKGLTCLRSSSTRQERLERLS